MKSTRRTTYLLAGCALALAALVPMTASAHTHVFLGIKLGGLFAPPPVEVYPPPRYYAPPPPPTYYAPPPPRVYYTRPAYYAPRVVYTYTQPEVIYYYHPDRDHRWRRGWRRQDDRGWYRHDDRDWRRHGHHDGDDGDD